MGKLLYLLAALVLASATSAQAQSDIQEKSDARYETWLNGDALALVNHLAECTVERYPAAAASFVLNTDNPQYFQNNLGPLMDGKCLKSYVFRSSKTPVTPPVYQPLLAQALLLKAQSVGKLARVDQVEGANDRPSLPAVDVSTVHPYYRDMFLLDQDTVKLGVVSECIARKHSAMIMQLAATKLGSNEEQAILTEIDRK